jgi:hypothetical protein
MRKPNFFIVGAPKCGTTALSEYLRSHPDVFFTEIKEPNFFNTDFSESYRQRYGAQKPLNNIDDYLTLFNAAADRHKAIGEGTVWYMYSQEAMKRIQTFNPAAKIIVMLRDPTDMAYSLHGQMVYSFNEDIEDFLCAWNLQEIRRQGKSIPRNCLEPKLLQYRDICMLAEQLERIHRLFPQNQIFPIIFDNFSAQTQEVYEGVLKFLKLESDARKDFPNINLYKEHRLRSINRWLLGRTPLWLNKAVKALQIKLGVNTLGIYSLLMRYNIEKARRKPLEPSIQMMLRNVFLQDICKLEMLLGLNLSHWKR